MGIKVIVVHGGGPQIEKELKKRKINNEEYQGLRVTTKSVLGVVKRILSHDLNKLISDEIKKNGGKTKRFNGVITRVLKAKIAMNGNIGFVGEPRGIDKNLIMKALKSNQIPVIAPLGIDTN